MTIVTAALLCGALWAQAPEVGPSAPAPQEYPLDNFAEEGEWRKEAVEIASRYLASHREELGLGPKDAPVLQEVHIHRLGQEVVARVHYREQSVEGVDVEGTAIDVIVYVKKASVMSASGRWRPAPAVPPRPVLSEGQARKSLVGYELAFSDFGGNERKVTVTEDALQEPGALEYVYLEDSKRLRLAWRIRVTMGGMPWDIFVDAVDGKVLMVLQQFQTFR